ncbi:hypothetical protein [Brumimicrobium sp.]|uniref:hypothetical protein n=1 Tax=Brumimicrobium sp. TaxID=2029867 RepID=UPI003A90A0EF
MNIKLRAEWNKNIDSDIELVLNHHIGKWIGEPNQKYTIDIEYFDGGRSDTFFDCFLSESEIIEILPNLKYLEEFEEHFETHKLLVDSKFLFPIIEDACGVFFISTYGKFTGQIFHVDNGDFGFAFVAKSLEDFKVRIKAFDF